ncbi:uncharacterized protein LAESUDRAFT_744085 [Laetiporus sulphureus 93-53]|uniref:F-box domain-containing protein n=1 Tax=Laetiporus sulphureus 93-53 TaxID=1314785 RepID=A0A165DH29_9APHY|nr:uncharacterized protein LAESUDRAFT_744085 [Laetiporus sulphureus 93-53]KZT04863.1 hypothetical protein LAESUDRAFT_744085 [Laetiporus sulphureus 93-53]
MPTFPTEVFEHIISFVWPDRRTLIACSLTCRAWLPRSRSNLLYSIDLQTAKELRRFSRLITAQPQLNDRIRELNIESKDGKLAGCFPLMLARKLTRVEHLRVYRPKDLRIFSQLFLTTMAAFTTITRLELTAIMFPSITVFVCFVSSLPNLTDLICASVRWSNEASNLPQYAHPGRRLKLRLIAFSFPMWSTDFVACLLTIISLDDFYSLNLRKVYLKDMAFINQLLEAVGPSLRQLAIGYEAVEVEDAQKLNLALTDQLEYIHLEFRAKGDWIYDALSEVAPTRVRQVTICSCGKFGQAELDRLLCDRIDKLLSQPKWASLRHVVIAYFPHVPPKASNWLRSEIPRRFPTLWPRALVRVEQARGHWWKLDPVQEG